MTKYLFTIIFSFLTASLSSIIAAPVDSNFAVDQIQSGNGKTKIAFDPSGRMFIAEKHGRVLISKPDGVGGFQPPTEILDIAADVNPDQEGGLLGMEIDPDYANNRFFYLFFTTDNDQRLVRYTMNTTFDGVVNGSENILLSGLPRLVGFHKAGDIGIHPLDPFAIFITLGDDGQVFPDSGLPQNINSYVGKILRVDTSTGLGLPDNPFYNGDTNSICSRVWASGLRNPFRFAFHPTRADTLYVSENGDSTDRVSMVKAGGNGLWEGNDNGGFLTVDTPLFKVIFTENPSLLGIEIATSGPLAYNAKPTLYLGNWSTGISRYTLSNSSDPQGDEWDTLSSIPAGGDSFWDEDATAMDLHLAKDGHLYFTQTGGDAALADWYPLRRYRYNGGAPPMANFTTNTASGAGTAPLTVIFTDSSVKGTNNLTAWHWDFGDGNTSTLQNPTHTYNDLGVYTVVLTVRDSVGLTGISQTVISATSDTSVSLTLSFQDGRSLPSIPATTTFVVSFFQKDGITAIPFIGGSGSASNELVTTANGTYNGAIVLPLTSPSFIMKIENINSPNYQLVTRGVDVSIGVVNIISETFYVSTTSVSGQVLTHRGNPAIIDIGVRSGGQPFPFAGARDFLAGSGVAAAGVPHRVMTDDLGYFSIPVPVSSAGAVLELSYAVDTERERYATRTRNVVSVTNTDVDASLTISEWAGGPAGQATADDLSGQAYTPAVAYSTVQNIFSQNCIGCHRANTTNNGGLDLTSPNSYGELVNQPSVFALGLKLVDPGSPTRSYLFEKINSPDPQHGARMRPTDAMSLTDQALIRDWITQLAPSYENFVWSTLGSTPGSANTEIGDDFDGDGISNGFEYAGLRLGSLTAISESNNFQGELRFGADTTGLTFFLQSSDDLNLGNWKTIASRVRDQTNWQTSTGTTLSEISPGVMQFNDSILGLKSRFYRVGIKEE